MIYCLVIITDNFKKVYLKCQAGDFIFVSTIKVQAISTDLVNGVRKTEWKHKKNQDSPNLWQLNRTRWVIEGFF